MVCRYVFLEYLSTLSYFRHQRMFFHQWLHLIHGIHDVEIKMQVVRERKFELCKVYAGPVLPIGNQRGTAGSSSLVYPDTSSIASACAGG